MKNKKLKIALIVVIVGIISTAICIYSYKSSKGDFRVKRAAEVLGEAPPKEGAFRGKSRRENVDYDSVTRYKNHRKEGYEKLFYPNGNIYEETLWESGLMRFRRTYDEYGNLTSEEKGLE